MVDWSLARQIARFAAGSEGPPAKLGFDLVGRSGELLGEVASYTRLDPGAEVPEAEVVGRNEWAEANIASLSQLLDPVAERLDGRMSFAGPLAGALRAGAGATLAAEAGLVLGYASTRVLGQYEVSLLAPEQPARLLYVGPNLAGAVRDLGVDRDSFFGWIAIHELTHVLQFQGVPWLREHLSGLISEYLETVEVRINSGAAGGLPSLPNLARIVDAFREGGLAALVQTREQRDLTARMQVVMSLLEGYAEHVMDALGPQLLPAYDGLRDAMQKRRGSRSAPERLLAKLLGMDMKMRQYEVGAAFCGAVVESAGIAALNRAWTGPDALPTPAEIEHPQAWIERCAGATQAA